MSATAIPMRKIGESLVHPIGFGSMGLSAFLGPIESDEERFKVLDAAYAMGSRHWDTSNVYGDSEDLIGKWFKRTGKRNEIFLATKFGITPQGGRGDAAYVRECIDKSLARLGVDYVDLFYQHRIDANTPVEITIGAMAELVKEGKVKYLGMSECSAKDLRRGHAIHPISAIQFEYSPFERRIESSAVGILQAARELGITIVAFSPLAKGLITGQYKSPEDFDQTDFRRTVPRYSTENFPKILDVSKRFKEVGDAHNATAGQTCLAWVLAQGDDFVIIPGTKKIKYLEENMGAEKVKLSTDEVATLRKIAEESEIPGERYGEGFKQMAAAQSPELPK